MVSEEASRFGSSLFTKEFIHVSGFTHCFSKIGGGLVCISRYYFLSAPECTNVVYSKELERDVTATAMAQALLRLKSLA